MRHHMAREVPTLAVESPTTGTANRLREGLRSRYGIPAEIRANNSVALVTLGRHMHIWVYPDRILWQSGPIDPIGGDHGCTTVHADHADSAVDLLAMRYNAINSERG